MFSKSNPKRCPKFYPILDVDLLAACGMEISFFAEELRAAGVEWMQYRNKQGRDAQMLRDAAALLALFADAPTRLILNDRVDLMAQSGFHGIHVGQQDASPSAARGELGATAILGVSTHTLEQIVAADATDCDYIAYGPIFATASKNNPDPVVGLAGLRAARRATRKPLVAIGGITRAHCRAVMDAGADSIAVISDLFPRQEPCGAGSIHKIAEEFLALLGS